MLARLQELWDDARSSWWFVPLVMAAGAVVLALLTTTLDSILSDDIEEGFWLYTGGAEGTRSVLETVAGSMITVAGVAFSIAIVVMTLASSQFGPRLLRTFMRDFGNQITLGTFVATFLFSILVLRTVRGENGADGEFVPHLSVTVAMLLTLASLAVFIYFIHHAARSIQADQIVAAVGRVLDDAADNPFPAQIGHDSERQPTAERLEDSAAVASKDAGYVQLVSARGLMKAAGEHDVIVELLVSPGSYVVEGTDLARVSPAARLDDGLADKIRKSLAIGEERTEQQDLGFVFDQLQQICLRALSPALNDPFTATICIDRMSTGLARLAQREPPTPARADDEGIVRVVAPPPSLRSFLEYGFGEVRRSSRGNVMASLRLLNAFGVVGARATRSEDIEALRNACRLVLEEASSELSVDDLARLRAAQVAALRVIEGRYHPPPPI